MYHRSACDAIEYGVDGRREQDIVRERRGVMSPRDGKHVVQTHAFWTWSYRHGPVTRRMGTVDVIPTLLLSGVVAVK